MSRRRLKTDTLSLGCPCRAPFGRTPLLLAAICLTVAFSPHPVPAEPDTDAQAQFIKAFLAHRPSVYRVVFKITAITLGERTAAPDPAIPWFEGGWSPGSFFVRQLGRQSDASELAYSAGVPRARIFAGAEASTYWQLSHSNDVVQTRLSAGDELASNPIAADVLNQKLRLDQVLNLGVSQLKQGALVWEGDRFVGEYEDGVTRTLRCAFKDKQGAKVVIQHPRIYGEIIRTNGTVRGICVTECDQAGPTKYLLQFEYDTNTVASRGFPKSIRRSWVAGVMQVPIEQIDIGNFEYSLSNGPPTAFTLAGRSATPNSLNTLYSNKHYYVLGTNGALRMLPPPPAMDIRRLSPKAAAIRRMVIGASMIALTLASMLAYFGIRRRATASHTPQTPQL